jgi:DeoR/GlpR family transcriptional regulator of sugar metabolism
MGRIKLPTMDPIKRRELIAARLSSALELTFAELAAEFGVSEMTARRDLDWLVTQGRARLVRGGAIPPTGRAYEPPLAQRAGTASAAKRAIGHAAAQLVNDGDSLILDVGSTVLELARAIRGRSELTVVTWSLPIAIEIGSGSGIRVVVTGGVLRQGEFSLTGGMAEDALSTVNCDLAFIGVAGLNVAAGLTEYNPDDARVKLAAISSARRTVVLADASKMRKVAFSSVAALKDIDVLVTDAPMDDPTVSAAVAAGVEVIVAPPQSDETWPGDVLDEDHTAEIERH